MNPDRTDKKSTFQIANKKLPGQNLWQHKTIQIIQSTCAKEISDDYVRSLWNQTKLGWIFESSSSTIIFSSEVVVAVVVAATEIVGPISEMACETKPN